MTVRGRSGLLEPLIGKNPGSGVLCRFLVPSASVTVIVRGTGGSSHAVPSLSNVVTARNACIRGGFVGARRLTGIGAESFASTAGPAPCLRVTPRTSLGTNPEAVAVSRSEPAPEPPHVGPPRPSRRSSFASGWGRMQPMPETRSASSRAWLEHTARPGARAIALRAWNPANVYRTVSRCRQAGGRRRLTFCGQTRSGRDRSASVASPYHRAMLAAGDPLQNLANIIMVLALGLLAATVLLTLILFAFRRRMLSSGRISNEALQGEVEAILEYFAEHQTERDMSVKMLPFWLGRGWTRRQRFYITHALIKKRILHLPDTNDQLVQFLRDAWYGWLSQPPWRLVLNGRDWTRMANDSGKATKHISATFGDVGPGANVQVGDDLRNRQDTSPAIVDQVVAALRRDAANADPVNAERAEHLAEDLEDAAADSPGRVQKLLDRAVALTASGEKIFEHTKKVLDHL
jgi:hypothetical protein